MSNSIGMRKNERESRMREGLIHKGLLLNSIRGNTCITISNVLASSCLSWHSIGVGPYKLLGLDTYW